MERRIRMGPIEFISSLGGLFGLCLGFSFISFFEIIYWATIVLARCLVMNNIWLIIDWSGTAGETWPRSEMWLKSVKQSTFYILVVCLFGCVGNIHMWFCDICNPTAPMRKGMHAFTHGHASISLWRFKEILNSSCFLASRKTSWATLFKQS